MHYSSFVEIKFEDEEVNEEYLIKRWNAIRKQYVRERRKTMKNGFTQWRFYDKLIFLEGYMHIDESNVVKATRNRPTSRQLMNNHRNKHLNPTSFAIDIRATNLIRPDKRFQNSEGLKRKLLVCLDPLVASKANSTQNELTKQVTELTQLLNKQKSDLNDNQHAKYFATLIPHFEYLSKDFFR